MRGLAVLGIGFLLCSVYLGVRVVGLEHRVSQLKRQLGAPPVSATAPNNGKKDANSSAGVSQEQRMEKLEAAVRALEAQVQAAKSAPAHAASGDRVAPPADDKILSVVTREQSRILDRQLQYHRSRWMAGREAAIKYFAQHYGLNQHQSTEIEHLLSNESDQFVALLRRPHAFDDPDQLARDWLATLARTDAAAIALLDPPQISAWKQARLGERLTLWPWLPNQ